MLNRFGHYDEDDIYDAVRYKRNKIKTTYMTTKEISRQLRLLDTKYANIKHAIEAINIEPEAQDNITDILDSQMLLHRQKIVAGEALFLVKDVELDNKLK